MRADLLPARRQRVSRGRASLMPLRMLPPVLLLAIFASQIVLVRTVALTPWKGGGFGMFSTLDHGAYRRVSVIVDAPDRSERVEIAPSIEEEEARAVACPSDRLLRRPALAVAGRERRHGPPVPAMGHNGLAGGF